MMDDIDRSNERDEILLEAQRAVRMPVQHPTGRCLNCEEPVPTGVCYCDADCRDDHEKELRLRKLHPC
jgi:hypothetical protein